MMLTATPQPALPAARLALTLLNLRAVFATHAVRDRRLNGIAALIWNYLGGLVRRLERLQARWQSGQLSPRRPTTRPAIRPGIATGPEPRPRKPRIWQPGGHAWLIRMVQPTAQFSGQIEALLADPTTLALLAAAPQAGRIFRPIYRMLGIRPLPPVLQPAPRAAPIVTVPTPSPPIATEPPSSPATLARPPPSGIRH